MRNPGVQGINCVWWILPHLVNKERGGEVLECFKACHDWLRVPIRNVASSPLASATACCTARLPPVCLTPPLPWPLLPPSPPSCRDRRRWMGAVNSSAPALAKAALSTRPVYPSFRLSKTPLLSRRGVRCRSPGAHPNPGNDPRRVPDWRQTGVQKRELSTTIQTGAGIFLVLEIQTSVC